MKHVGYARASNPTHNGMHLTPSPDDAVHHLLWPRGNRNN